MIKMKQLLTEKKKVDFNTKAKVRAMTQKNQHNTARALIAKNLLNDKGLTKFYNAVEDINMYIGHLPPQLAKIRQQQDEKWLLPKLMKKYEDWKEIWSEL